MAMESEGHTGNKKSIQSRLDTLLYLFTSPFHRNYPRFGLIKNAEERINANK